MPFHNEISEITGLEHLIWNKNLLFPAQTYASKRKENLQTYYECESPCCIIGWKLLPCQQSLYLFLYKFFQEESTLQERALSSQIGSLKSLFKALAAKQYLTDKIS